ncbi:cysteine synthase family protein [Tumebacillus flagellatus]|uniref:Cysteine synthase n=1 Tax=Tumebacillus flagellatus TaxID=1157490 RepID=A0A074LSR5_9BACL|nr:cysteine synthase family protein [Tumebacillus flagellatus]KEO82858.1 cysteine synthase [Tumebacillus flagellatus]
MKQLTQLVGDTPIVQLRNVTKSREAVVWLKMERTNPGGSIKDRPALYIVEEAERRGLLRPGGTIIESSSGNFGISLAMIGAARGYRVIILVDPKTTPVNLAMLKAYGAEVIVVTEQDDSGSYHKTRISLANKLHREIPHSFRPDQCFNPWNGEAHYRQTAAELWEQCDGELDTVILTVSTGGQLGGFSRFFHEHAPHVQVIGVDAVGSTVFGGTSHPYLLPGMGLSWTPTNLRDLSLIDEVYKVPDEDAFLACRTLARHEGILAGGSTGAGVMVAMRLAQQRSAGSRIVCIASDNGERYLPTIYNDEWMAEHAMTLNAEPEELRRRARLLEPYSLNPIETANYRADLAEALDSPSRSIMEGTMTG